MPSRTRFSLGKSIISRAKTEFIRAFLRMNRPISRIMAKTVWTVGLEDAAEKVEELLNRRSLSAVPVVDEKRSVFGIISSADILHLHAAKKNPKSVRAWE